MTCIGRRNRIRFVSSFHASTSPSHPSLGLSDSLARSGLSSILSSGRGGRNSASPAMASAAVVIVSRGEDKRGEKGVGSGTGLCLCARLSAESCSVCRACVRKACQGRKRSRASASVQGGAPQARETFSETVRRRQAKWRTKTARLARRVAEVCLALPARPGTHTRACWYPVGGGAIS